LVGAKALIEARSEGARWSFSLLLPLLLISSAFAQKNTVSVRLFSQRGLQQLRIEPTANTLLRSCRRCVPTALLEPRTVTTNSYVSGSYRIAAPNLPTIPFAGESHITTDATGLHITVTLAREDYVAAVLAGEVPPDSPPEFLKAMAVAVRTYAFHESSRHKLEGFDFCDSTHCQNLKLERIGASFRAAAETTKSELLWHRGQPALTYYHQDCGGRIAEERESWPVAASAAYVPSHEDPYCLRANGIRWQSELRKIDLSRALRDFPSLQLPAATVAIGDRTASGRVHTLRFNRESLSASSFRFAVGRTLGWNLVRSDLYDLRDLGDRILLTGRGSGHGVGLCQDGAAQMAREGKSYRDILAFYYPGTRVGISAQEIPWQRLAADNLVLWTTDSARDGSLLPKIPTFREKIEEEIGLHTTDTLQLRVYPELITYRNATGGTWLDRRLHPGQHDPSATARNSP
jgi:stage II sporulation protein D